MCGAKCSKQLPPLSYMSKLCSHFFGGPTELYSAKRANCMAARPHLFCEGRSFPAAARQRTFASGSSWMLERRVCTISPVFGFTPSSELEPMRGFASVCTNMGQRLQRSESVQHFGLWLQLAFTLAACCRERGKIEQLLPASPVRVWLKVGLKQGRLLAALGHTQTKHTYSRVFSTTYLHAFSCRIYIIIRQYVCVRACAGSWQGSTYECRYAGTKYANTMRTRGRGSWEPGMWPKRADKVGAIGLVRLEGQKAVLSQPV